MKKLIYVFFAVILLAGTSCKQKIDVTKEKEAVLKVLQEEGDASAVHDLKRVLAVHIQDSTATRLEQVPGSYKIYAGWDEIKKLYESYYKENTTNSSVKNLKNLKENIIMKVVGNSAWVMCDNIWKYDYQGKAQEWGNTQIAFFEKVNNEWKFSFDAFISKPESDIETQLNLSGYTLLSKGQIKDAITIFKMNIDENPLSSNVYDSYAEALMKDGQNELAIKNYKRSIELDSTNINAKEQIKILESRLKPISNK
jgi:tetratricopeptide (TPR) repeat protein